MNKVLKKGILITLISIITLSCFSACFPTPQKSRNNEVNGIQLQAEVSKDERIPIIRTMTLEDYQSKDEAEKEKLHDSLFGNVEGDIPCVHLLYDNTIRFRVMKDGTAIAAEKPIKVEIMPELTYEDEDKTPIVVTKTLQADTNNTYTLPLKHYRTQYETYFVDMYLYTLYYSVDGVDYISLLASSMSNLPDDKTPFDSEPLEVPIPAEIE